MINVMKIKRMGSYILAGFLPAILFLVGILNGDIILGLILLFVGMGISMMLGLVITKHAFTQMLEGEGLCTLTLDSTGLIIPFITKMDAPFIKGTMKGKEAEGVYNRDMIGYFTQPQEGKLIKIPGENFKDGEDRTYLKMPTEKERLDYLFRMDQYPCLFFNKNIDAYLSKDELSTFEKEVFTKNNSLFILKKTQQLSSDVRDFARYIVEHAKPGRGILANRGLLIIIVIVIIIIIFALLFGPAILQSVQTTMQSGGGVLPGGGPIN